jgi:o-succinylbenzoate synthase
MRVIRRRFMQFRFQFRRYRLSFRTVVRTAHGPWAEREGVIVRLEDASRTEKGRVGFGEAAPMAWFGTETIDEVEAGCRNLGEWVQAADLEALPRRLGCLRSAIGAARHEIARGEAAERDGTAVPGTARLGVAALLPAGRTAVEQIGPKAEIGFRVFKWKVGVADLADELALLDDVCAALPNGGRLRLDANGAWDRRKAERWLERCAERPVEFVEQPCFADAAQGETAQRRTEDILLGLAQDYPTPIALDESLAGDGDVERWLSTGWPGVYVVKASLLGDVETAMAALERARARVVFSSALETAVGARAALMTAFHWAGALRSASESAPPALGFGVWPLFADMRFDGPAVAPYLRYDDVVAINPDSIWNALS